MKRVFVTLAILGFLGTAPARSEPPPTPTPTPAAPSPLVISITGAITVIKAPPNEAGPVALVPIARGFGGHSVPDHAIYIGFDPDAFRVTNNNSSLFLCLQDEGVCLVKANRLGEVSFDVTGGQRYTPPAEDLSVAAKLADLIGDTPDPDVITRTGNTPGSLAARVWLPKGTLTAVCDSLVSWWDITPVGGSAQSVPMTHTIDFNTDKALTQGNRVALKVDSKDVLAFEATGKGSARLKIASVEPSSDKDPGRKDHHFLLHYLAFVPVSASGKITCSQPGRGAGKGDCPFPERQKVGCRNPTPLPGTYQTSSRGSNCPPAVW